MYKDYYIDRGKNLLFQNIEDDHKRHELESIIAYKDITDNSLKNCFDQLKN